MNINKALNQLADTYEHGPEIYCFSSTDHGNPHTGDVACVLGHLGYLLRTPEVHSLEGVAWKLGHEYSGVFYKVIRDADKCGVGSMTQTEVAVALRKYAATYHPVPDKVALVIVKPQALAA